MLSNVRFSHDAAARVVSPGPLREAGRDLAQALRRDDLSAANQAYASLVKAMPEGTTLDPGTPFARVGEALAAGDMAAAKSAYADIFRSRAGTATPLPTPGPVPSSTGGASGSLVNTVA